MRDPSPPAARKGIPMTVAARGQIVLEPTGANRQPAVALYERGADGDGGLSVQVLTVVRGLVGGITGFVDRDLFPSFGLQAERPR